MKTYNVYVNGNAYVVQIEEAGAGTPAPAPVPAPVPVAAPVPAPAPAAAPAPAPAAAPIAAGANTVTSPMPGTILSIAVKAGDSVKAGQVLMILEAMKMETPVAADKDGVIASVDVTVGAVVAEGDALISIAGAAGEAPTAGGAASTMTSPLPGTVTKILVKAGDAVKAGDTVIILEAMKMETPVAADKDGVISSIDVTVGTVVAEGDALITIG